MRAYTFKTSPGKLAAIGVLAMASLAFMSCYYMPGLGSGGTAKVNLRAALAAGPPSSPFMSVVLVVSGPEMGAITNTYTPGTTTATLTVPAGASRTFTLLENTLSVTFMGTATVDLAPGDTKSIVLTPTLAQTQIIVPDALGGQIVQISDMKGTGSTSLTVTSPYDVDFDSQGQVYIASSANVVAVSNISPTSIPTTVASTTQGSQVLSIAIDRTRGLLYFTDGSSLYGYSIQGTPTPVTGSPVSLGGTAFAAYPSLYVTGIAVDSDGFLYMAGTWYNSPNTAPVILKLDVSTFSSPQTVGAYAGTLVDPWDVLVNSDYIYVSDYGARQIVRLTKSLAFVDSFSGPPSDPFFGPERFVAILNKPIAVIDEVRYSQGNRLVAFNDMTGAGWTTYEPESSPGADQFLFFYGNSGS